MAAGTASTSSAPAPPAGAPGLRLHGAPALLPEGQAAVALEPRAAALCALAALEPGVTRLRAAMMLWPDSPDPRRNLRQQLLRFRQQFGHPVVAGAVTLSLADGVALAPAVDGAVLLAGIEAGGDTFGSWLAAQRDSARRARREPLLDARTRAEDDGDFTAALRHAQDLLVLEPHEEAHHTALMRLHYLRGEPAAGLAAWQRLGEMLAAQYGSAPGAASREIAQALRSAATGGTRALAPRAAATALPVVLRRPPLTAGRAAEAAAVQRAWAEGRAVMLEGEAGLGKSRLAAELAGPGALVGAGRPGDGGAPFSTLARWLAPLLAGGAASLPAAQRAALDHLVAGAAPASVLRPGAMEAAVGALLDERGVAVAVLDDLHVADAATLELAAALAARSEPPRRWLFAQRPAEAPPAAAALRDGLLELQRLDVVPLAPLDARAAAELVDTLALDGFDARGLAEALVRHTGGNPLYMLETLKQGLHDGSLARGELPRPANVGALIERRLQRLSEAAITLARVAAIAGIDFSVELAEAATGRSAVELAGAWHELQQAQVLRDEAFAHDLVCDAVLRGVPQVVARRVHAQCARWLEAQGIEPARVARHWRSGGDAAKAGHAFVAAARRAERAGRIQEEAALHADAAQAYADAGLADEHFTARCDRARALANADFGDLALQEVRTLVAGATNDAQRLRAQRELVGLLSERGQSIEAVDAGRALMTMARRHGDQDLQVRTGCHMANALCRLGRADEALSLLLPLREWVETQRDDALRMLWHGDWAATLGHLGRLREAVAAFDVARAAARRAALPDAEGRLVMNAAVALRQSGRFDRALALAQEGQSLSSEDALDATHRAIARLVIARDECETGRYATALAALEDVLPQFEAARAAFWTQAARMVLATLWLHLGQPARAMPLLRGDEPEVPAWLRADRQLLRLDLAALLQQPLPADALPAALALAEEDPQRGPWLRVRALRHRAPAAVADEAATLAAALGRTERHGVLMALEVQTARAALAAGRADDAARTAARMLERFDEGIAPDAVYRADAYWVATRALQAAGRSDDAARALRQGTQWISQHALPNVPPAFIDSFLHRNPVNRALLAAAGGG